MPRKNGPDAYADIRAEHPQARGIFMSGYAPDAVWDEVAREGNIPRAAKPIVPAALLRMVRDVLDEAPRGSGP